MISQESIIGKKGENEGMALELDYKAEVFVRTDGMDDKRGWTIGEKVLAAVMQQLLSVFRRIKQQEMFILKNRQRAG